jgi:hypothetical protein
MDIVCWYKGSFGTILKICGCEEEEEEKKKKKTDCYQPVCS